MTQLPYERLIPSFVFTIYLLKCISLVDEPVEKLQWWTESSNKCENKKTITSLILTKSDFWHLVYNIFQITEHTVLTYYKRNSWNTAMMDYYKLKNCKEYY